MSVHTAFDANTLSVSRQKVASEEQNRRETTSLLDLARILYRRRRTIIATIAIGIGLALLLIFLLPPFYVARATLAVSATDPNIIASEQVTTVPSDQKSGIDTHVQRLLSAGFLEGIVDKLGLAADPEFANPVPLSRRILDWATALLPSTVAARANELVPGPAEATPETLHRLAIAQLALVAQTRQVGNSYVIALELGAYDADKAARIANAMAEEYVARELSDRRAATTQAAAWIAQQIAAMRDQVSLGEQAVAEFQRSNGLVVDGRDDPSLRQLGEFNSQLVDAQARRAELEARVAQLEAAARGNNNPNTTAETVNSPTLIDLRNQISTLEASLAERSRTYGTRHPEMVQGFAQRDQLRSHLDAEVRRIVDETRNELAVARSRENILRRNIAQLEERVGDNGSATVALYELRRKAEASNAMYKAFLGRYEELEALKQIVDPGIKVDSSAGVPAMPSFPNPPLFLGVGFIGSALLGCLLAFAREALDSGVHTKDQVRRAFGLPTLAMIPDVKMRRRQRRQPLALVQVQQPRTAYMESIAALRTELRYLHLDGDPRLILVTSSLPDEGKSTLATSLAIAEAAKDSPVLLVDLDLHRGELARVFGLPRGGADLIDVLTGEASLDQAIIAEPKGIPGLHVLSAYNRTANPGTLLGSRRMTELLTNLRHRYRLVVLDSPPVLAVHDARLLSPKVDAILFVVRWGWTKIDAARAGLELLTGPGRQLLGVVISRVDVRRHAGRAYGDALQYRRKYADYYGIGA